MVRNLGIGFPALDVLMILMHSQVGAALVHEKPWGEEREGEDVWYSSGGLARLLPDMLVSVSFVCLSWFQQISKLKGSE